MTAQPPPETEPVSPGFEAMLSALVDGQLSATDQAWLERRLTDDPRARAEYRDFLRTEFLLAWEIGYGADKESLDSLGPAPSVDRVAGWLRRAGSWLLPLMAAGLVAGLMLVFFPFQPPPTRDEAPAMLTAQRSARWQAAVPPALGEPLASGPMQLVAGAAQITFASGAVIAMTAPAEFEILGRSRMFLRSGRITPFVPESAKGFTVVSPSGEVIDLGTEFSMAVAADGATDVFVISGEVEVNQGHAARETPVRLSQGFAARLSVVNPASGFTQRPLLIDHFDAASGPLGLLDVDIGPGSEVRNGGLWIPIGGSDRRNSLHRVVLLNDFSSLAGRRSTISFKATLPSAGTAAIHRWLALVLDGGQGDPPRAYEPAAVAAVMVSPQWQASVRSNGQEVATTRKLFARQGDAVGPYQVVLSLDDSAWTRHGRGSAIISVMVNGLELLAEHPITFGDRPRLTLQTYVEGPNGGRGWAVVDDFSVSVDATKNPGL